MSNFELQVLDSVDSLSVPSGMHNFSKEFDLEGSIYCFSNWGFLV